MRQTRLMICVAAAAIMLIGPAPARADLCKRCKGKMYITSVGKCAECGGLTSSGAFKLCRKCSRKLKQCEHCRGALGAVGPVKPEPPVRRPPIRPAPRHRFDMRNGGTYTSGKWKYILVVRAVGTRSERRGGTLYYDGRAVPKPQANDYYRTPWGFVFWVGERPFGNSGWMPLTRGQPGRLLPAPKAGTEKRAPIELDEAANGKAIQAEVGQEIHLRLKGNPTTGYSWRAKKTTGTVIQQMGPGRYVQDKARPGMVGVGGRFVFRFQAIGADEVTVSLAYARPWEKNKPPIKTFTLKVTVAAAVDRTQERSKLLLGEPRNFALHLSYCGDQDKPYYSLLLRGARPKPPKPGAPAPRANPFALRVPITKRQVERLVAHLAESGFLREAKNALKDAIPPAAGPCYLLRVTGGPTGKALDLRGRFGWGRGMFQKLDALRAVLFGPAAEAMDRLLGRLSGHRKALGAAEPKPAAR